MLINDTKEKLTKLRLHGMNKALGRQLEDPDMTELSFEERLGILVEEEYLNRENLKLTTRLRQAKLKQNACLEDLDYQNNRGITKSVIKSLNSCQWISKKQNIIITGPTGTGKTYLANALAQKACREGFTAAYYRVSRLFEELTLGKGDGSFVKILDRLLKKDLLVLDDWGLIPFNESQCRYLFEILEDRYDLKSVIIASQVPVKNWYELLANPNTADAILDRVIHNSHKFELKGVSMRKKLKNIDSSESQDQSNNKRSHG